MADDVKVVSIIPKDTGVGGTKTGYVSHSVNWQDTRYTQNVSVVRRRWQRDYQAVGNGWPNSGLNANDDANATASYAIHAYTSYASAGAGNPNYPPNVDFFSHNTVPGGDEIFEHSVGVRIAPPNFSGLFTTANMQPVEFLNVKDRMFCTTGGQNQGLVYKRDGGTDSTWVIGIDQPQAGPQVLAKDQAAGANRPRAFGYAYQGQVRLCSPDPAALLNVGNAISVDIDYKQSSGGVATRTTNTAGTAVNLNSTGEHVTLTNGSRIASWDALPTGLPGIYIGLQLVINGYRMIICEQGNISPNTSLAATQMMLAEPYNGPSVTATGSWAIIGSYIGVSVALPNSQLAGSTTWTNGSKYMCPVWVRAASGGPFPDWGTAGPQYAYSYYDADTGHVSNASPVAQAADPASANCSMAIPADTGSLNYASSLDQVRFKYLLFYRTMTSGGSSLFPVGSLQPTFSDGTWNPRWRGLPGPAQPNALASGDLWEDAILDSELLLNGAFVAPQFTNNRPRLIQKGVTTTLYPLHWTYWDQRIWMVGTQDKRTLRFSCDIVQCPFGLPEESFPDTNILPVPAGDGEITGFCLVGNLIIVLTRRWAYYIAGNNETNYRLMRLSTDLYGVGTYQATEIPGPTKDTGGAIGFIGRDRRVYVMQPGQRPQWISEAIQSQLDSDIGVSPANYTACRIHYVSAYGRRRLIVRTSANTYRYDFASQTWDVGISNISASTSVNPQAFTTCYTNTSVPINEVFVYNGTQLSWLRDDTLGYYITDGGNGFVELWPSTLDGKKTFKQLEWIRIYVSDATKTWGVSVRVNEESSGYFSGSFTSEEDAALSLYASPATPVDGTNAGELVCLAGGMTNDPNPQNAGPPLIGFRFVIRITFPQDTTPGLELYAIQIGYKDLPMEADA